MRPLLLAHLAGCAAEAAYLLSESYVDEDFYSRWNVFNKSDPTHGAVKYVSYDVALREGLVNATADRVYMGANMDTTYTPFPDTGADKIWMGRHSVRLESKVVYLSGLFILTLDHIPTGCGTWPAYWMFGQDSEHIWPEWGEYDIIEGMHTATKLFTSLHTSAGCMQPNINTGEKFTTRWSSPSGDCSQIPQGCAQDGPEGSMGRDFNSRGGGTFATEWDPDAGHLRTWFWPNGTQPQDVLDGKPSPQSWGLPFTYYRLSPDTCPPVHLHNARIVFDLTFCGDLGGPTFKDYCQEFSNQMSCDQFVAEHPEQMQEAYWSIRGLDVYQLPENMPSTTTVTTVTTSTMDCSLDATLQNKNCWSHIHA